MSKIHEWLTNEGSGLPQDSIGGKHATATGATWYVDADIGICMDYDGATDATSLPQLPNSNMTTLTMECIFKPDNITGLAIQQVVGWVGSPAAAIGFNNSGQIRVSLYNGSTFQLFVASNAVVANNIMYTVRFTADYVTTGKPLKIYLNNDLKNSFVLTGTGCKKQNASGNDLGRLGGTSTRWFNGKLGRVSLWDSIEPPGITEAGQPEGENFDDASLRTPIHMDMYGRTNGLTSLLTGWITKDGVTNPLTVTIDEVGAGWYDVSVSPNAKADWDVFVRRTDTGELWWQDLGELPQTAFLDVPRVTQQNNYHIVDDTKKPSYSGEIEVNEITRARVELPRSMEEYIVDVTAQNDARAKVSVKKALNYFEVYGDRAVICRYTVLDITKMNKDTIRAISDARRSSMGAAKSILTQAANNAKRPLQQI